MLYEEKSHMEHIKGFFSELKIDVNDLIKNIDAHCGGWQSPTRIFGRKWCRGIKKGMDVDIDRVIALVERKFPFKVDQIFANLYENGNHKTGFHSDQYTDSKGDPLQVISASFGGTRPFHFRKIGTTKICDRFFLQNGDLFRFDESINERYQHAIPVSKTYTEPRVNLTIFSKQKAAQTLLSASRKEELMNAILNDGQCVFEEDEEDSFNALLVEMGILKLE